MDTDYDGWVLPDGMWDERRMRRFLDDHPEVVVSGTVENQALLYDSFEHVVLLAAPLDVLLDRVSRRTNNPYGTTPEHRAEIARHLDTVEPLLRRGGHVEVVRDKPSRIRIVVLHPTVEQLGAHDRREAPPRLATE